MIRNLAVLTVLVLTSMVHGEEKQNPAQIVREKGLPQINPGRRPDGIVDVEKLWSPDSMRKRAEFRAAFLLEKFTQDYNLTPEQRKKVEADISEAKAKEIEWFVGHSEENIKLSLRRIEIIKGDNPDRTEIEKLSTRRQYILDEAPLSGKHAQKYVEKHCTPEQIQAGREVYFKSDPWLAAAKLFCQRHNLRPDQQSTVFSIAREMISQRKIASNSTPNTEEFKQKEQRLFDQMTKRFHSALPSGAASRPTENGG